MAGLRKKCEHITDFAGLQSGQGHENHTRDKVFFESIGYKRIQKSECLGAKISRLLCGSAQKASYCLPLLILLQVCTTVF